jgi:tetratricopeptide (TPR) repeat protein
VGEERLATLREMLALDPDDAFTRYALAMELKGLGRMDDALAEFAEVLTRDPAYLATYYQYGALLSTVDTEEAVRVIRAGIAAAKQSGDDHTHSELNDLLEDVTD